jgi:osmotically-inducible protein OsmY
VVTLSGTVRSAAERERSIQLAKETTGVTRVVDHLKSESQ